VYGEPQHREHAEICAVPRQDAVAQIIIPASAKPGTCFRMMIYEHGDGSPDAANFPFKACVKLTQDPGDFSTVQGPIEVVGTVKMQVGPVHNPAAGFAQVRPGQSYYVTITRTKLGGNPGGGAGVVYSIGMEMVGAQPLLQSSTTNA